MKELAEELWFTRPIDTWIFNVKIDAFLTVAFWGSKSQGFLLSFLNLKEDEVWKFYLQNQFNY